MGRSFGPRALPALRLTADAVWLARIFVVSMLIGCLFPLIAPKPALAQTAGSAGATGAATKGGTPDQSLLNADSIVYAGNTATAVGHVQIYYQGRVLQADRVTFDRSTNRVLAEGHAKLTDADGSVLYGRQFELTQDLKSGFIDAIQAATADKTFFTAPRAERAEGKTTTFERGAYTACEPCKEHPERPPLWQIKAKKIVHDADSKTIYYEDAALEFYGVPLIYLPYFSTPDPSVDRKSGVLAPKYSYTSQVGLGLSVPYFFDLAPNYDLTVTPGVYSRQGVMLSGEWRQRLMNGAYNIQLSGIFQADPNAFISAPYGAGNLQLRGQAQSDGEFYLNQNWKFGWNLSLASDKFYVRDYGDSSQIISSTFFGVNTSTAYLTGQDAQSYFDLRGYYFQALSPSVLQRQQPVVAPVISYNRTFELDPKDSGGIGGEFQLDAHIAHLDQSLATYQASTAESLDQAYNLYDVCETAKVPTYTPGACSLRGIAGDYTNASVTASWQRKFIDPIGEVWTPFAFAHLSGTFLDLNTTSQATFSSASGTSTLSNASQPGLLGLPAQSVVGEAIPGVGTEWRYPFVANNGWGTQILEPIAQIIARPNESPTAAQINEDSQSLVFDDTNLFEWNKFSGADRFEGGTRLNYGAQYAMMLNNGGYANVMFGQSYQLAGQNSYATQDALAVGLGSGLATRASDYIARIQFAPTAHLALIAKTDLDPTTFQAHRIDVSANAIFGNWEASLSYARYLAQPSIGYYVTRQGLSPTLKVDIAKNFFIDGNVVFDMSRHYYNAAFNATAPLFSIAGLGVGIGYSNDCATLSVNYTSVYQADLLGPAQRNQTVALNIELKTLGDTQIRSGLADLKVEDGLQTVH